MLERPVSELCMFWPCFANVVAYAATVALAVSLHGPVAPLVLTQRER